MIKFAAFVASFGILAMLAGVLPAAAAETLPAGTLVQVRLLTPLSSADATVGQEFPVQVAEQVVQNNHILITRGAHGTGRVVKVTKAYGKSPGELTIEISQVTAVDGSPVPVTTVHTHGEAYEYGKAHTATVVGTILTGPFGLLFHNMVKGKDITIPTTQTLGTYVESAVAVEPHS